MMIDPVDSVTHPLPLASPIVLYFQSASRFYRAELGQDLLNDWIVMLSWGGRCTNHSGCKVRVVSNPEEGIQALREIIKLRKKKGYTILFPNVAY